MAAVCAQVLHDADLPTEYSSRIPPGDTLILRFLIAFLEHSGLPGVPVYINGGYVRDLLLGKVPDDLDLSICLRDCPEEVTVAMLLEQMPGFAAARPDLGISEVKIATILSNESKDKQLDTFKAHFTNAEGVKIEVDVMPTIGEEVYSDDNRIPIRDQRGLPEEDALRRDLTIGALLLNVSPSGSEGVLAYRLLDYYGGVEDIQKGILRSPYPLGKSVASVAELVLRSPEDQDLARALGLDVAAADERTAEDVMQVIWWAKVLMDDPLRICRALRFAAKFGFELHPAFWLATPFALEQLRAKVAGSRKNTEYQKIGGYGFKACQNFFELAFMRTFGPKGEFRLGAALFGGQDEKSRPKTFSEVKGFDLEGFREYAAALTPPTCTKSMPEYAPELVGSLMAAAAAAADFDGSQDTLTEFNLACDGMCVSNAMREAGFGPLQAAQALAAPLPDMNGLDTEVAKACGVSVEDLALHVQVWRGLKYCDARSGPASAIPQRRAFALALLRKSAADPGFASRVAATAAALEFQRPVVRGTVLAALQVPPPLRNQVMLLFEVGLRMLRCDTPVEGPEQLEALFAERPLLKAAFSTSVWMEDDGKTLRAEFQRPNKGGAGKPSKKSKC